MGRALKTKEVAKVLGVSSRTIQRWVRHYNIPYQTNSRGHFQFTEQHVKMLEKIRDQMNQANAASPAVQPEEEVKVQDNPSQQSVKQGVSSASLQKLEDRLFHIESMLSTKADQVVYEQALSHRRELDNLSQRLDNLEAKLTQLEEQMTMLKNRLESKETAKRTSFFSRFSLAKT